MKITKKSQKNNFKPGYSSEKALEELGFETVEEMNDYAFNILNIEEASKKDGVEYLKLWVHSLEKSPIAIKLERTDKLVKQLEKVEVYSPVKFENIGACVYKKKDCPRLVYYNAERMEVL